jgi:hypothetical protein
MEDGHLVAQVLPFADQKFLGDFQLLEPEEVAAEMKNIRIPAS